MTFHTTRWTLIRNATGQSAAGKQALSDLCAAYYGPVVAYIRHEPFSEDAARDLAHEFFRRLLQKPSLQGADPALGSFRNYLCGALKHFLAHERERSLCQKRGGGAVSISLDAGTNTTPGIALAERHELSPDEYFDRQWALAVIDRASAALAQEHAAAGNAQAFARLQPWLTGDAARGDHGPAACSLGMSEGALRIAVHRLRRRFRQLLKAEIAHTLDNPTAVDEEMRHLYAALAGPR
jgi:RNA polymerase sigma-70 factor (ECF subfamily)